MKFDLKAVVKDLKGEVVKIDKDKDSEKQLLMSEALYLSCVFNDPNEKADGDEKFKRFKLAEKALSDAPEFSIEEMAKLKVLVGKYWGVALVGVIYNFLEKPLPEEPKKDEVKKDEVKKEEPKK